ncbi:MAG: ATP-binding cassette domain-containing protein [Magnetospirillum sp.]|jgi:oligopeptide/dipeptide ABC transporter ATP-binding protein|nr:ATP-binding cassette domain-containing protein [Magnetospirillum sp.]
MTALLEVRELVKTYTDKRGRRVSAVDGVNLDLAQGEVLGIVGESGCGKTTLGRTILRLMAPDAGTIRFEGTDIAQLPERRLKPFRREMQMIFQDPFGSLNPRHRVGTIVGEPLAIHGHGDGAKRVAELLETVGLGAAAASRFPHEFSGGQRQRIAIARALALGPKLIVADEPVSALDVSIQSQIINLIADLRRRLHLSMLFITHDLSVVRHVSDRIAVMYLGRIVESGATEAIFAKPRHPYTQALISAIPRPPTAAKTASSRIVLKGEIPDPADPPPGCRFHRRCPIATEICARAVPELKMQADRLVACHHALSDAPPAQTR